MPQQNVEKMAKDADEMHRKMYPEQYGDPPLPPDPDPAAPPETPPAEPAAEPVTPPVTPTEPTPPAEPATPTEGTPPPAAVPDPSPPAESVPPATPAPEPWEQRYNTLQGKYNAEVPRLIAEVNVLKQQLTAPPPRQPDPVPAPAPATPLTIKEILSGDKELEATLETFKEDYPDVADLLVKLTERASSMTSQKVNEMVNNQFRSVQEFQAESRTQHFWEVVNKDLPDWQVIRDDPEFALWLNETEPYTGLPRSALAQDALQKLDANRVVSIYNGFRQKKGSVTTTTPSATSTTPPAAPGSALISPPSGGRTAPAATPSNTEPPITSAFIAKFYSDAAMRKYINRQAEFDKIESRINKAVSEGRVL